ncbi:hypothetical protein CLV34_1535 [Luteimicrobium subarcticum]|uniref:Uncharacterized protein n=2 Tax=Luteimicrobium subarcticum TaxID=620910 RepID=A0A2M8WSX3_9MICO|nr:hypothetical protein CLV34_1535 [Luteimicrobium subarcticum]
MTAVTVMVLVLAPVAVLALRGTRWDVTDAELREAARHSHVARATRRSRWTRGAWGDGAELDPQGAQMRELAAIDAARSADGAAVGRGARNPVVRPAEVVTPRLPAAGARRGAPGERAVSSAPFAGC